MAELYCDGDGGGGGSSSGYYDAYDDPYSANAYDDDAIVTGRTRYGYNRYDVNDKTLRILSPAVTEEIMCIKLVAMLVF